MPPIPHRYAALPASETAATTWPADNKVLIDEKSRPGYDEEYGDEDDHDNAAFFTSASRASGRHRAVTLGFIAAFATIYACLFGASIPSFGLSGLIDDARSQLSRGRWPSCPHFEAVGGYQAALDNLDSLVPTLASADRDGTSVVAQSLKQLEDKFLEIPTADGARAALRRYSDRPHYAGLKGDYELAVQVLGEWADLLGAQLPENHEDNVFDAGSTESRQHVYGGDGVPAVRAWIDTYSVLLNYPINSSVTLSKAPSNEDPSPAPYFTASLREDTLEEDPDSKAAVPAFHGYAASGRASGKIVFAGMGRKEDFDALAAHGVDVKGAIVLVSYGGTFRGLKVRAAQEAGATACLIYTDPIEDGKVTPENGFAAYPHGPARNPSAIQRGSVQSLSFYPGDPGTPEKPSYRNATRIDPADADSLPKIPSLPLSWRDAKPLLESLKGKGKLAKDVNERLPGAGPGIEYWTGPSDDIVHVENFSDLKVRDIWNTYAVVEGMVKDEVVMRANHLDSWNGGGADPNSGSASLHETIKGLGELVKGGWKPLRTMMFASWDAEEYGLLGSTEFGEDYADWIRKNVVVYHNSDVSVAGSELTARGSPSLAGLMSSSASVIDDPESKDGSKLVLDANNPLGSGSDFTVFLQYLGIPSTDAGYSPKPGGTDPVYMYHSIYDNFNWMDKFGDPGFKRHETAAKLYGVSMLRTAGALFSPINVTAYGIELGKYLDQVEQLAEQEGLTAKVDLKGVRGAIKRVQHAASFIDKERHVLEKALDKLLKHRRSAEAHRHRHHDRALRKVLDRVRRLNQNVRKFEQGFIDKKGLPGRTWYKHLGVAPGRWKGYGATTLPGLTEAISLDGGEGAQHEADRLAKALKLMADRLYHH